LWVRRSHEHGIKPIPDQLHDIGRRLGRGRFGGLRAHEFGHRRAAVGDAAARKDQHSSRKQRHPENDLLHASDVISAGLRLRGAEPDPGLAHHQQLLKSPLETAIVT
jgi:hypothetical protein